MTGNPRRRIPYPLPTYGRKCADTEPVKLANTAPAVEASFACGSTEGSQPFVPGCRGAERPVDVRLAPTEAERRPAAHCWGQGVRVASGDLCGKAAKAPTEAGAETNAHWQVKGGSHYRVKDEVPWRVEGGSPIGSRAKRLAQGKLMRASTYTGYYLTQNSQDLRLRRPFPGPRTSSQEGGNLFETDTTQWALRQAWHL